jgi:hypothetical protein
MGTKQRPHPNLTAAPKPDERSDLLKAQEAGRELAYWTERLAMGVLALRNANHNDSVSGSGALGDDEGSVADIKRRNDALCDFMVDALANEARDAAAALAQFRSCVPEEA